MAERESIPRTLGVAAAVALLCSLLVSTTVYWLRPIQLAYRSIDQNRAVLLAAALIAPEDSWSDRDIVERYLELEAGLVDLDTGAYTDADAVTAASYDYRAAMDEPRRTREISGEHDSAGLGRRPQRMPVYVLRREGAIEGIVLPIYGRGMWSMIHGFLCLGPDLATVVGVNFYDHGETPGIGDRIEDPAWLAQWNGKRLYDASGQLVLRVGTGTGSAASERVDAITGATVTVTAIDRFIGYWFGDDGYGPFLAALRSESS